MSWRNKISWRWIIRGTCLGLLGLCVGLWGLSYFCSAGVFHEGDSFLMVGFDAGHLGAGHYPAKYMGRPSGWSVEWRLASPGRPFVLHLLNDDLMGFTAEHERNYYGDSYFGAVPFWCPAVILVVASWIAWRKTGRGGTARGFPVEPLAPRRESDGG